MARIYVDSNEISHYPELAALGTPSPDFPRAYHCDVLVTSRSGIIGVECKHQVADFLDSMTGTRLVDFRNHDLRPNYRWLVIGEPFVYGLDGYLVGRRFTRSQINRYLVSCELDGIRVHQTGSLPATVAFIRDLAIEADKADRRSGIIRPKPSVSETFGYGPPSKADFIASLLTAVPGWSAVTARSVVRAKAAQNAAPLTLLALLAEPDSWWLGVKGVGKGRLAKLREVLG